MLFDIKHGSAEELATFDQNLPVLLFFIGS